MGTCCALINRFFASIGKWLQSPLLLILRLFFGISLLFVGWGKLQNIPSFTDNLISLGIPYPHISAWLTGLGEFIGGFLLAIGLLSRFAALVVAFIMSIAYSTVHIESIHALLTDPTLFIIQPPFNYLLVALLVFAFGPGFFSLDSFFFRKSKKEDKAKD
jgi:putative oxidoreductase